jgi:hypothetical protein
LEHYRALGALRASDPTLCDGSFRILLADGGLLVYERSKGSKRLLVASNRGDQAQLLHVPHPVRDALTGKQLQDACTLAPDEARIFQYEVPESNP